MVDRGGVEVRYVIDYYHDESGVDKDELPAHMHDFKAMKSIVVDVRPAVDSIGAVIDRIFRMPLAQVNSNSTAANVLTSACAISVIILELMLLVVI